MKELEPYEQEEVEGIIADQPNLVFASLQDVLGSQTNISNHVANQNVGHIGFILLKGPLNETVCENIVVSNVPCD